MNYCSNCGTDELKKEVPSGDNRLRIVCGKCGTVHYQNPKIIAGCLPIWDGKVLLCRRAIEPRKGYWNLPAGFMEIQETPEQGAAREVWEEAMAKVENLTLHNIFTMKKFHHVYVQFLGDLVNGEFGVGEESLESKLFGEEEIPWDEIAFSSSVFALKKYFEDRRNGAKQVHLGEW